MADLVKDGEDTGMGGCQTTGLRDVLQGDGAGGSSIQAGDVGYDLPHGKCPGKLPG